METDTGSPAGPPPLAGLRVLDFSRVLSGPFAGRMLADLGADVVKVEPPEGDVTRYWGEVRHGLSGFYTQQNAGKRNVCIDLKTEAGRHLAHRLCERADIVIENYRPGVFARLGLTYDSLSSANPGLILLAISGFGATGPDRDRPAYATVIQAESGLVSRQAECDAVAPTDPLISLADMNAALHGLVAVLSAVVLRQRTGQGQYIDLSMLDAMLVTDDYAHHALDRSPLVRMGGEFWDAPGGPVLLAGDFRHLWRQLSSVHGLVDPTPPDADVPTKAASRRSIVGDWLRSFDDREKMTSALDAANLAWADVRDHRTTFDQPSVEARRMVAEVDDRGGGTRRIVESPYRFSSAAAGVRGPAPYRGEHNREVLADWVGLDDDAVEAALQAGALLAEDRPAGG
ncbi:MAG TPA: CaiB/BaiF CoA-transferase family protein [Acidimicrobiales bacterium]|nr:CaiB/BaiF CoA-transferase family protein [Acidimicrobiales bacterium]